MLIKRVQIIFPLNRSYKVYGFAVPVILVVKACNDFQIEL